MLYKSSYMEYDCDLKIGYYALDQNCMSLNLVDKNDEPVTSITTNLGNDIGNGSIMQFCCGFVDVNNNPNIEQFIKENELGEPYMRFGEPVIMQSGFCQYPLYQFNQEKLEQLDKVGFENYKNAFINALNKYQANMSFDNEPDITEDF